MYTEKSKQEKIDEIEKSAAWEGVFEPLLSDGRICLYYSSYPIVNHGLYIK